MSQAHLEREWTLACREGTRKSKKEAEAWQIGCWSGEKVRWSPKGKPKRGRLDVEAGRGRDEVQKGSWSVADWMLKRGEGMMKSKKAGEEKYNGNSIFYPTWTDCLECREQDMWCNRFTTHRFRPWTGNRVRKEDTCRRNTDRWNPVFATYKSESYSTSCIWDYRNTSARRDKT